MPMAVAMPPYPHRHSGTALVCGFAACLWQDLASAPPGPHFIIAVNAAITCLPRIDAALSFHYEAEKLGAWVAARRGAFVEPFTVHAPGRPEWREHNQRNYPHVDHWWDGIVSRGGSAWIGVRLARAMGFERVILCGSPIDRSGYADGGAGWYWTSDQTNAVEQFRRAIAADTDHHVGVSSMSGWTRELLGEP